jgi:hypothetical protein
MAIHTYRVTSQLVEPTRLLQRPTVNKTQIVSQYGSQVIELLIAEVCAFLFLTYIFQVFDIF